MTPAEKLAYWQGIERRAAARKAAPSKPAAPARPRPPAAPPQGAPGGGGPVPGGAPPDPSLAAALGYHPPTPPPGWIYAPGNIFHRHQQVLPISLQHPLLSNGYVRPEALKVAEAGAKAADDFVREGERKIINLLQQQIEKYARESDLVDGKYPISRPPEDAGRYRSKPDRYLEDLKKRAVERPLTQTAPSEPEWTPPEYGESEQPPPPPVDLTPPASLARPKVPSWPDTDATIAKLLNSQPPVYLHFFGGTEPEWREVHRKYGGSVPFEKWFAEEYPAWNESGTDLDYETWAQTQGRVRPHEEPATPPPPVEKAALPPTPAPAPDPRPLLSEVPLTPPPLASTPATPEPWEPLDLRESDPNSPEPERNDPRPPLSGASRGGLPLTPAQGEVKKGQPSTEIEPPPPDLLGEAVILEAEQQADLETPRQEWDEDLLGSDVLDADPVELEQANFQDAADAVREMQKRVQVQTQTRKFPDDRWYREQPMRYSSGAYGVSAPQRIRTLTGLYFRKLAMKQYPNTPIYLIPREARTALTNEAQRRAENKVIGTVLFSQQHMNFLVEKDLTDQLEWAKGQPDLSDAEMNELIEGGEPDPSSRLSTWDRRWRSIQAVFRGTFRPSGYTVHHPEPVARRESTLWWMTRASNYTAFHSWYYDPKMKWEFGGTHGFGGERHLEKIVLEGYTVHDDPNVDRMIREHPFIAATSSPVGYPLTTLRAIARLMRENKIAPMTMYEIDQRLATVTVGFAKLWLLATEADVLTLGLAPVGAATKLGKAAKLASKLAPGATVARFIDEADEIIAKNPAADVAADMDRLIYKHGGTMTPEQVHWEAIKLNAAQRIGNLAADPGQQVTGPIGRLMNARADWGKVTLEVNDDFLKANNKLFSEQSNLAQAQATLATHQASLAYQLALQKKAPGRQIYAQRIQQINGLIAAEQALVVHYTRKIAEAQQALADATRQYVAMSQANRVLFNELEMQRQAFARLDEIERGTIARAPWVAGDGVIEQSFKHTGTVFRATIKLRDLKPALAARYPTIAANGDLDKIIASPVGDAYRKVMRSNSNVGVETFDDLKKFEEALHRQEQFIKVEKPASRAVVHLSTLAHGRTQVSVLNPADVVRFIRQPMLTKARFLTPIYQILSRLERKSTLVGGSALGKHSQEVQEELERLYGISHGVDRELADLAINFEKYGFNSVEEAFNAYLKTTRPIGDLVFNQVGGIPPAQKLLNLLRALSKAGDEAWAESVVVKAMAAAPLPSNVASPSTFGLSLQQLRRQIDDPNTTAQDVIKLATDAVRQAYLIGVNRTDVDPVILRNIVRAAMFGAAQWDAFRSVMRRTGPAANDEVKGVLDFLSVPDAMHFRGATDESLEGAIDTAARWGMPVHQLSTARGFLPMWKKAQAVDNQLKKQAVGDDYSFFVPQAYQDAINNVPQSLAKELIEFNRRHDPNPVDPEGWIDTYKKLLQLWSFTNVHGFWLPRATFAVDQYAQDMSQIVMMEGPHVAAKVSARTIGGNLVGAAQSATRYVAERVPFYGPKLEALADKMSPLKALTDPFVEDLLRGRAKDIIYIPGVGHMSKGALRAEAHADGVFTNIATPEIIEALHRRPRGEWSIGLDVPQRIMDFAKMAEYAQIRRRMAMYGEMRLKGVPRDEARGRLIDALYDWTTGVPESELKMMRVIGLFWRYRRNQMRQLGRALGQSMEWSPTNALRIATGNTTVGRAVKLEKAREEVTEEMLWPDGQPDPENTIEEWGKMHMPWWSRAATTLASYVLSPEDRRWWIDHAGRRVNFEDVYLTTLTTTDTLWKLNLAIQTAMATSSALANATGLETGYTHAPPEEIGLRVASEVGDFFAPGTADIVESSILSAFSAHKPTSTRKGQLVPKHLAIPAAFLMERMNLGVIERTKDGEIRVDGSLWPAIGSAILMTLQATPMINDLGRITSYVVNPGWKDSAGEGLARMVAMYLGIVRFAQWDPFESRDDAIRRQEYQLRNAEDRIEAVVNPTRRHDPID